MKNRSLIERFYHNALKTVSAILSLFETIDIRIELSIGVDPCLREDMILSFFEVEEFSTPIGIKKRMTIQLPVENDATLQE